MPFPHGKVNIYVLVTIAVYMVYGIWYMYLNNCNISICSHLDNQKLLQTYKVYKVKYMSLNRTPLGTVSTCAAYKKYVTELQTNPCSLVKIEFDVSCTFVHACFNCTTLCYACWFNIFFIFFYLFYSCLNSF